MFDDVAQGGLAGFGGEGADLQAQIAVAPAFLQLIVGEVAHFLQMNRFFVFESEPAVKQAAAHPHGNGQSVGVESFAQNAAVELTGVCRRRLGILRLG